MPGSIDVFGKIQDHPQLSCYFGSGFRFIMREQQPNFGLTQVDAHEVLKCFLLGLKV